MNAGLTDEALKYLALALSLDPNHYRSLNLRGLALLMRGSLTEAAASFEKCVQLAPAFSDGYNNLGTVLQEKSDAAGAEAAFRRAFEIDANYNASFNLAKILYQQGKLDEALDYVQRSIRKFPVPFWPITCRGSSWNRRTSSMRPSPATRPPSILSPTSPTFCSIRRSPTTRKTITKKQNP